MGCGASAANSDGGDDREGTTRFTNASMFTTEGLDFDAIPEPVVGSQGMHPRSRHIDAAKRSAAAYVKTNEGGFLAFPAAGTAVDVLFLYPEFAAVNGKAPTTSFGLSLRTAKEHVKDDPDAVRAVEDVAGGVLGSITSAASSVFDAVASRAKGVVSVVSADGMTMEDASDDDLSSPGRSGGGGGARGGPTSNHKKSSSVNSSQQQQLAPGAPAWTAAVCQFKEFDSLDDITKPWHRDAGGGVPGILRLETAGPAAAWATMEPHTYQQRWALPDGDRVATFTDDSPSIPQRILSAYRACGGDDYLRALIDRVQAVRRSIPEAVLIAAFDAAETAAIATQVTSTVTGNDAAADAAATARKAIILAERARELDVEGILSAFGEFMTDDGIGSLGSVYDFPEGPLDDLKSILGYVEDCLLYNWLEVAVEAEVEVGTQYFVESDAAARRHTEWKLFDTVMRKFLEEANGLTDDAFSAFKSQLTHLSELVLHEAFAADEAGADGAVAAKAKSMAQAQIDALFPDLPDMVAMDADSIDAELLGIRGSFDDDDGGTCITTQDPTAVSELLQRWRRDDGRPLEDRRRELYEREMRALAEEAQRAVKAADAASGLAGRTKAMRALQKVGEAARIPRVLPRHFHDFTFILLFPRLSDHPTSRKPLAAKAVLWPESCLALEVKVSMVDFTMPHGGVKEENPLVEQAVTLYDTGDDEIDSADDPRKSWSEYPSGEWRGFQCTVEVAMGVTYNFNFELDGHVFLDHNSFIPTDDARGREYFRRVRFAERARVFTFNPLRELGLVA